MTTRPIKKYLVRAASSDERYGSLPARTVCGLLAATALFCFFSISAPRAGAANDFDRNAWQEDYAYLKNALERNYANLAWFGSPQGGVDIPALDARTERALDQAESNEDARAAIFAFVAAFHDGHFSRVAPPRVPIGNPSPTTPGGIDANADCGALGYSATTTAPFSLPVESIRGFALETNGAPQPFRAGVFTSAQGTRFGVVRIHHFRPRDFPGLCIQVWTTLKQSGKPIDAKTVSQGVETKWFEALAAQLQRFQTERVDAVIVDVGDNSGGSDEGDWTPRLFSNREVHSARLLMAAAPAASAYFDEQLNDLHKAIDGQATATSAMVTALKSAVSEFEKRKAAVSTKICQMSWVWREQRSWNPAGCTRLIDAGFASGAVNYLAPGAVADRNLASAVYWPAIVDPYRGAWTGPVYVLTNGKTYSAAEMFAAVMRDNRIAKLVGSRTGGDGCGFMHDDPPTILPNSQLQFRVPDCVRLRADSSDEVAGIQPDLPVQPGESEDRQRFAMRVLDAVQADLLAKSRTR